MVPSKSAIAGTFFVLVPVLCVSAPAASPEELAAVVAGNNRFALDLYQELAGDSGENLFLSPYSVSTALAMTYAGARGNTAAQMAQTLHFPFSAEEFHPAMGGVICQINDPAREGYTLNVANRLWGQQGYPFLPEFLGTVEDHYSAGLEELDFIGSPEPSRATINQWVEDQTNNKIQNLLPQGSITPDTRLVLTNAIYFLGDWKYQFDPKSTSDAPFFVSPQESITLPLMQRFAELRYGDYDGVQVVELPYQNEELSLVAFLPDDIGGLPAFEAALTPELLDTYLDGLVTDGVSVWLPRFEMTSQFALGGTLSAMGMTDAFDPLAADFSGINGGRDLFISSVVHKAFIQLDEKGTEAAAATGVVVGVTSVDPDPIPEFRADHPFCFLIRDNLTESILFLGRVVAPEASKLEPRSASIAGDLDGDGLVGSDDLDLIRANWGRFVIPGDAASGDADGDGVVGSGDLDVVRFGWGSKAPASVPEPGTGLVACALAVGLLWRRRRHQ